MEYINVQRTCDVDIRDVSTMKPVLFFETANTTTQSISADAVYAMSKGSRKSHFQIP